jgi:DNA-directed RNA polymerase specialized sigma24 family protein
MPLPKLAQRAHKGDKRALELLYLKLHADVRATARRFVADSHAAEDISHDVFVKFRNARFDLARSQNDAAVRSWFYWTTYTTAMNYLRVLRREAQLRQRVAVLRPTRNVPTREQELIEKETQAFAQKDAVREAVSIRATIAQTLLTLNGSPGNRRVRRIAGFLWLGVDFSEDSTIEYFRETQPHRFDVFLEDPTAMTFKKVARRLRLKKGGMTAVYRAKDNVERLIARAVNRLRYSPDTPNEAVAGNDNTAFCYDTAVQHGELLERFEEMLQHLRPLLPEVLRQVGLPLHHADDLFQFFFDQLRRGGQQPMLLPDFLQLFAREVLHLAELPCSPPDNGWEAFVFSSALRRVRTWQSEGDPVHHLLDTALQRGAKSLAELERIREQEAASGRTLSALDARNVLLEVRKERKRLAPLFGLD